MHLIPGEAYHIYNRGNNSGCIFFNERNYHFFLQKITTQLAPTCEILCWCLMPNHFHLIIYATEKTCALRPSFGGKPMQEFQFQLGKLLSSYSQAMNKQNRTTGSLFQQKTKAKLLTEQLYGINTSDSYIVRCMHYIHQNPLKAKMVKQMEDWPYSSFREYAGMSTPLKCNTERLLLLTGYDAKSFYKDSYAIIR